MHDCIVLHSPAFIDDDWISCACEVFNITRFTINEAPVRFTHSQEVRPQSADGVFGDVGQRLAQRRSKHERSHGLVHTRYILITEGSSGPQIYGKTLTEDYLWCRHKNS